MENLSKKVRKKILQAAENDYKKFSAALIPNINNVLGVRLPVLRKIAKEIYEQSGLEYLKVTDLKYMEEVMLQGMIIGQLKSDATEIIKYVEPFVSKIDNWSTCDNFCSGLKFTKKNKSLMWDFLQFYLKSENEYELRFGFVMLLSYFVDDYYIDKIFAITDCFHHDGYYAKMAVAWALSVCYVKQADKTYEYLKNSRLDDWTYNKCIQKICDSYRVEKKFKNILITMKRQKS